MFEWCGMIANRKKEVEDLKGTNDTANSQRAWKGTNIRIKVEEGKGERKTHPLTYVVREKGYRKTYEIFAKLISRSPHHSLKIYYSQCKARSYDRGRVFV